MTSASELICWSPNMGLFPWKFPEIPRRAAGGPPRAGLFPWKFPEMWNVRTLAYFQKNFRKFASSPMSATLTPKRKSARDRPASSNGEWGDGGEKAGDRPRRSTGELEVGRRLGPLGRRRVTLAKMNSARERALPAACEGEEVGTVPLTRHANQLRSRSLRSAASRRPISQSTPSPAADDCSSACCACTSSF